MTLTHIANKLAAALYEPGELGSVTYTYGDTGDDLGRVLTPAMPWLPVMVVISDRIHDGIVSGNGSAYWTTLLVSTLVHEMVHAYCYQHGITDIDPVGRHTQVYADAAREHGLLCMSNAGDHRITLLDPDYDDVWESVGATDDALI